MTIRLLRTLVAVADEKTFSAAAQKVHVTHAAVSQQMQTLEADLGIALFDRTTRTPTLTPLARQVVAKARTLIRDYDNLVPSILADGGLSETVTLGAIPTTLTGLTPRALRLLKRQYPQMGLHIRPGLTQALLAEIERKTLDAAIISKPHLMPIGIDFRPLAHEPMHLIAAAEETEDDPEALLRARPFIRFNRTAVVGGLIDSWILSRRIRVDETMELDSLEAIASMVGQNLGISIVPSLAVKAADDSAIRAFDLGPDAPERVLGLAYPSDSIKSLAIDALHDALSAVIGTHGDATA